MKFNIITLGCKVNIYESEVMKEKLLAANYLESDMNNADIIIINTCSVTNMADNKSKKMVRRAIRLNKITVVCGCSSENNQNIYKEMGINILLGNKDKSKIIEFLEEYFKKQHNITKFYNLEKYAFENMKLERFTSLTRAFIKIQDGCNNFCSYCIIPYTRKNVRSKDFDTVLEEANSLIYNGHKEIVLTGIHTGAYQSNGRVLADLIHELSKIENLERIRISSIEITEINDKLLNEIKNNEKLVNHLHIPLQAGSNEILKIMNRKYDIDNFKKKINKIRKIKEDISITTDVIVGHPYETEELFYETVKTCEEINFSKIHVFPYSPRKGTPAAKMPMQVSDIEKKKRVRILNEISNTLENTYYKRHLNTVLDVLIEEVKDTYSLGFTSNYIRVRINEKLCQNRIYSVKIKGLINKELIGIIVFN